MMSSNRLLNGCSDKLDDVGPVQPSESENNKEAMREW